MSIKYALSVLFVKSFMLISFTSKGQLVEDLDKASNLKRITFNSIPPNGSGFRISMAMDYKFINCPGEVSVTIKRDCNSMKVSDNYLFENKYYYPTDLNMNGWPVYNCPLISYSADVSICNGSAIGTVRGSYVGNYLGGCLGESSVIQFKSKGDKEWASRNLNNLCLTNFKLTQPIGNSAIIEGEIKYKLKEEEKDREALRLITIRYSRFSEVEELKKAEKQRLDALKISPNNKKIKDELSEIRNLIAEKEKEEKEKAEKQRIEAERIAKEKAEKERLKKEKEEQEKVEKDKKEVEKEDKLKAENEKIEKEKAERLEAERLAAQKAEIIAREKEAKENEERKIKTEERRKSDAEHFNNVKVPLFYHYSSRAREAEAKEDYFSAIEWWIKAQQLNVGDYYQIENKIKSLRVAIIAEPLLGALNFLHEYPIEPGRYRGHLSFGIGAGLLSIHEDIWSKDFSNLDPDLSISGSSGPIGLQISGQWYQRIVLSKSLALFGSVEPVFGIFFDQEKDLRDDNNSLSNSSLYPQGGSNWNNQITVYTHERKDRFKSQSIPIKAGLTIANGFSVFYARSYDISNYNFIYAYRSSTGKEVNINRTWGNSDFLLTEGFGFAVGNIKSRTSSWNLSFSYTWDNGLDNLSKSKNQIINLGLNMDSGLFHYNVHYRNMSLNREYSGTKLTGSDKFGYLGFTIGMRLPFGMQRDF
jgi:hypothetical protein